MKYLKPEEFKVGMLVKHMQWHDSVTPMEITAVGRERFLAIYTNKKNNDEEIYFIAGGWYEVKEKKKVTLYRYLVNTQGSHDFFFTEWTSHKREVGVVYIKEESKEVEY
jgi:hypothetical protein